jgi:hypothetical protein
MAAMSSARRVFVSTLLIAVTTSALCGGTASAAGGWSVSQAAIPLFGQSGELVGISCPATALCVAVGTATNAAGMAMPLAESLRGSTWTIADVPVPATATVARLFGVSCASSALCIAVGDAADSSSDGPLAEVWDGKTWSMDKVPVPGASTNATLSAVSCSSATICIAVGHYFPAGTTTITSTFAELWNGTAWSLLATQNPTSTVNLELSGVSCTSATACTAVGGGASGPLAESWNGTAWSIQSTIAPAGSGESLDSVSCQSTTSCTAVGSYYSPRHYYTLLEYWDGKTWAIEGGTLLRSAGQDSLSCMSHLSCLAVGGFSNDHAEYWNGSTWTAERTVHTTKESFLEAVACVSSATCIAVGQNEINDGDAVAIGEVWDGTSWSLDATKTPYSPVQSSLTGVSCPQPTFCMAVGAAGGPYQFLAEDWNGTKWSVVKTPAWPNNTAEPYGLSAISCVSAKFCMAVGALESAAWNGTSWTVDTAGFANAVSCVSPTFCMSIYNYSENTWNGTSWTTLPMVPLPTWKSDGSRGYMSGVSCTSAIACTVVGWYDNAHTPGSMLADSWNGTSWSIETTPIVVQTYQKETLASVSCTSGLDCTAVGTHDVHNVLTTLGATDNGTALSLDASAPSTGTSGNLTSVSCISGTDCNAIGNDGQSVPVVEHWNGSVWSAGTISSPGISSISCASSSTCAVVGGETQSNSGLDEPLIDMGS